VASESAENATKIAQLEITTDAVQIAITEQKAQIEQGVDEVVTTTGYSFGADGLQVSKTGSEMTTTITEDGMKVYRDSTEVLSATNTGVHATNLHADTYLIVGTTSRFETYENNRTACFWIGG
jgi:hypothetical protein